MAAPQDVRLAHQGSPESVWLTAVSLGSGDPAPAAHPNLPRVVVLDEPLLRRPGAGRSRASAWRR